MKQTSIEANKKAEKFKPTHRNKILGVLDRKMTGKEISDKTGLEWHAVSRRMSELGRENKVMVVGVKDGYSVYEKIV